jgi:TrmH family RNA methyltransferase
VGATDALGAHNPRVRDLRALLQERAARDASGCFVVEGPRVLAAALENDAPIVTVYVVVSGASSTVHDVVDRAAASGVSVISLTDGAAQRLGDTVTTQGVFAVVRRDDEAAEAALATADFVVVADQVNDPGNAGTLWRSAAAAGAGAYLLGRGSVDAYNPKLVRASAGACFRVPVVGDADVASRLRALGARGVTRVGAAVAEGAPPDAIDFTRPCALVLGHEARGLDPSLPLDARVTIPMAPGAESLNVAMAGTTLCFEVARQRRLTGASA